MKKIEEKLKKIMINLDFIQKNFNKIQKLIKIKIYQINKKNKFNYNIKFHIRIFIKINHKNLIKQISLTNIKYNQKNI